MTNKKQSKHILDRKKKLSRRRALVLLAVNGLFIAHFVQWKMYGKTVSPAELNEAMFTIEQGVITVGAILLVSILISVFFFGRFFCSWGCHIMALQDLSSWVLQKCHIKPISIRSRVLPLVAVVAFVYMFIWPTLLRMYNGVEWGGFKILTDKEGLGSFTTEQFTRNLPGIWMTSVTFIVVGFFAVWFLGSRGFCRFVCPYGALFAGIDRVSPAGIQLTGDCDGCGQCTAACTSNIQVHYEIQTHGRVVTPTCMKDLDCVMSCPRDAIKFGYGKLPLKHSFENILRPSRRWPWSWREEVFAGITCLGVLLITRSLYGEVPFLLALTLGVIYAWAVIKTIHLYTKKNVKFNRSQLKLNHSYSLKSAIWSSVFAICTIFLMHSAWIRWHEFNGQVAYRLSLEKDVRYSNIALHHLLNVVEDGIWRPPYADVMIVDCYFRLGSYELATPHLIHLLDRWPENDELLRKYNFATNRLHLHQPLRLNSQ
ncbi:MAG: 4Fe-4S binding protein [Phycisphaerae bacterium]|nr:4Fe-4S binding protein [Phycisphaerae bacterium]